MLSQDGLSREPLNGLGCAFTYTTLGPVGPKKGMKCCAICTRASMTRLKLKKKNRTEYAIAVWSRTQGTQRELPKVAGFQCAKQGMSLLVQALDYLRTTAYRMQKEER